MADFYIKQNDSSPALTVNLVDDVGGAISLIDAQSIRFHMARKGSKTLTVDSAVDITDVAYGVVEYVWDVADTSNYGLFMAEFEVIHANGKLETFPNHKNLEIYITEDLT